jgi:hypothetical protein
MSLAITLLASGWAEGAAEAVKAIARTGIANTVLLKIIGHSLFFHPPRRTRRSIHRNPYSGIQRMQTLARMVQNLSIPL